MKRMALSLLSGVALVSAASAAHATIYTTDGNLSDFYTGTYATFSNYLLGDAPPVSYTPTNTTLNTGVRVYDGTLTGTGLSTSPAGQNWILASFLSPTSSIRVFPSIDHFPTIDNTAASYDGFQYAIEGSNDGLTWTALFDATSVVGLGEPFTLGTFTGTAPTRVNNVLTPGGPSTQNSIVGYIADFTFPTAYQFYALGSSTVAIASTNLDQEFSAVGPGVPEPTTLSLLGAGLIALGFVAWRRRWFA
jgi:hypothetical protein